MKTSERLTTDFVPKTYDDMFRHYYDYVVKLVGSLGIDQQNSEDVAMTILTKFFEKDVLSDYNPEYISQHDGVARKAVFRTFLSGFVATYVRHYRDRQFKLKHREGFSTDTVMFRWSDSGEEHTWMDYLGPRFLEEFDSLHEFDFVRQVRSRLQAAAPRNAQDRCDLPAFFDAVLQQNFDLGKVDVAALAEQFEVSKTSIQNWMKRLRAEVYAVVSAV